jgi:hypothetical protein
MSSRGKGRRGRAWRALAFKVNGVPHQMDRDGSIYVTGTHDGKVAPRRKVTDPVLLERLRAQVEQQLQERS